MLFGRMQTAAEIPLHTNGAECDIRLVATGNCG